MNFLSFRSVILCVACVSSLACQEMGWREYSRAGLEAYARGDYGEAEKLLSAAVDEAEHFGPEDTRLVRVLVNLAGFYRTMGRHAEAEPLYGRALAMSEESLGLEHPTVAMVLENYAQSLRKTGRAVEADEMETRAKAIRAAN